MTKAPVTVGLIGLPKIEVKRLHAAFDFSLSRNPSYMEEDLEDVPNIIMVNSDEASSLIVWRTYRNKLEDSGILVPPTIIVSKNREFHTKHYQVKRPLITSRIIKILDEVTRKELTYNNDSSIFEEYSDLERKESVKKAEKIMPRALVIDDSMPVRIQMDQALKSYANVDFAESGEQGISLSERNQYDLIFLDVVLPDLDGYEVCNKIKNTNKTQAPVIMLTGSTTPADKIKGRLAGCDTYLIKPISRTIFDEVIRQYI